MFAITVNNSIERRYTNNGQHAEMCLRYTLTGKIEKADNRPATECADCLDIQIKSARATVCKGLNLDAYLANDRAKRYAYVLADFSKAYIMEPEEYKAFCRAFATPTRESTANGGGDKLRLKSESKALRAWLQARA